MKELEMKVTLAMLLCLAMVHYGIAHSLSNVMFQAQDSTAPKFNVLFQTEGTKCDVRERLNFLESLPNGIQYVLSLRTITSPLR
jgi:phosphoglycerate-specific signal transduction histidine kinase